MQKSKIPNVAKAFIDKQKHEIQKESIVFQCPFYKVIKEDVSLPNGKIATYYTHVANNPFVAIIAIKKDKLLVQHQFRPTIKVWNWEFPMGALDNNESALEAAKRELLEETGYGAESWTDLGFFYVGPGHSNNFGTVFLAQNIIKKSEQNLETSEIIEPKLILISDFEKLIADGTIKNGPTLACWQMYQQKIVNKAYQSYLKK